ncbi:T9SS type A sorting domain-containing protein [Cellulophaga sp. BC115SP]|nr:T9SS type A sorting domain-containing protein [Cellulophaga sp. BC115SP]
MLPLGIDEGINSQVNVYPNPSSDKVTVKVDYQGNTQIRLIDAFGNEKYSGSFKGSIEIPIQHFSAGIYFIQLNNTNTIKLLIQ